MRSTFSLAVKSQQQQQQQQQDLHDQAAENTVFFSKIDLKSAYHQIPLRRKHLPLTAFEVNERIFDFTRLPFGVTNAVAVFRREMVAFVRRHSLKRTHPYLDDVIIGGRSEKEHQENLKNFLKAAEIEGLTLNKAKCVFGCETVPMLGHIVELDLNALIRAESSL